jgi:hypothetical protein
MKKIQIRKGDDQIITFRSNGKKIAFAKVFPGNDLLTLYVHPSFKKRKHGEINIKLFGNYIRIKSLLNNPKDR